MVYDDSEAADRVLAECAEALSQTGARLGGVVQSNPPVPGRRRCAMSLKDLATGAETRISQDLGDESAACRLDHAALAQASLGVERGLEAGVDLLIINRFGKQEAQGGGFRAAIASALLAETPVLTGVSRANLDAGRAFAGGAVTELAADPGAILAWCRAAIDQRRH
jgi:nucleoside-triphosphatase THEP1